MFIIDFRYKFSRVASSLLIKVLILQDDGILATGCHSVLNLVLEIRIYLGHSILNVVQQAS